MINSPPCSARSTSPLAAERQLQHQDDLLPNRSSRSGGSTVGSPNGSPSGYSPVLSVRRSTRPTGSWSAYGHGDRGYRVQIRPDRRDPSRCALAHPARHLSRPGGNTDWPGRRRPGTRTATVTSGCAELRRGTTESGVMTNRTEASGEVSTSRTSAGRRAVVPRHPSPRSRVTGRAWPSTTVPAAP